MLIINVCLYYIQLLEDFIYTQRTTTETITTKAKTTKAVTSESNESIQKTL